MDKYEFSKIQQYVAKDSKVRLDNGLFSSRESSGIRNGIKQGYWLSMGKISWLANHIADEYGLPFVRASSGRYGGLHWNAEAGKLPGFSEAITALYAYERLVSGDAISKYTIRQYEEAIRNPTGNRYIGTKTMSDVVRGQFAKLNAPYKEQIDKFIKDWEANNIWVTIA